MWMILFQKMVPCTNVVVKSQIYKEFAPRLRLCRFGCSEYFHCWSFVVSKLILICAIRSRIALDALTPIGREGEPLQL